ncbi:hypothetical protein B0A48_17811 [Cryoendolithus antarcticus]|uniref:Peptidase A1 domain-containing protein n=1 Tax=Cryoendolithus antarcticus TaxID=1507870 RepID=A0A1V8SB13_9PEZI|nr:hypothetical protein B0A48_17811 [Cryoendolithus antarcticus]
MRVILAASLAASVVSALPEISIAKHSQLTSASAAKLRRRDLSQQRPRFQAAPEGKAWFEEQFGTVGKGILEARDAEVLRKRAGGTVETNVYDVLTWSNGGAYYANVTAGTPPQDQVVILDTGSSDLYFDATTAPACEIEGPYSCRGGEFDKKTSSTYQEVDPSPAFNTSFGDGSTAVGPFAQDVIGIGNVAIKGVQFGLAEEVNSTTGYAVGLMGLGYSLNEASQIQYPNMPEVLKEAGVTNSRLYSVYLNDEGDATGSILFGGIDKSKYTGNLATLNLLPDYQTGQVYQFVSVVTAMSANVGGRNTSVFSGGSTGVEAFGRNDPSLPVLLDTGSAAWTIPASHYRDIASAFTYIDQHGYTACSNRDNGDSVTLTFGGEIDVTIPAREFIVPVYNASTNEALAYDSSGAPACTFLLVQEQQATGQGFQTLGDAILRSMYVVFDLDNGQVSIAQAQVNSTSNPDIVTVPAGEGGVASAVGSGVETATASQTYSIAQAVNGTATFEVSTAASTVGSATGTDAVPLDARPDATATGASGNGGSGSGSGGAASSSGGAVAGRMVGAQVFGSWGIAMWIATMLGVGIGAVVL